MSMFICLYVYVFISRVSFALLYVLPITLQTQQYFPPDVSQHTLHALVPQHSIFICVGVSHAKQTFSITDASANALSRSARPSASCRIFSRACSRSGCSRSWIASRACLTFSSRSWISFPIFFYL
jgi:hypothetical protein